MRASIRSRLLLLALSVLLPGIVAAAWAIGYSHTAERQAIEYRLGDTSRTLLGAVDGKLILWAAQATALPLPADAWRQVIGQPGLPLGWQAAIIDPQGVVVARWPVGPSETSSPTPADLNEQRSLHREGLISSQGFGGDPVMAFFSTSPLGWTAVTSMPRDQFTESVNGAVRRIAAGALALLVVALLGVWWAAELIEGIVKITPPPPRYRWPRPHKRKRAPRRPGASKPSGGWPAAWRTISTTCSASSATART